MKAKMKILIAYDGSKCGDGALDELNRAGLPDEAQAVVMSVAELWIPPPSSHEIREPTSTDRPPGGEREALALAQSACERIRLQFPAWEVEAESLSGSPAREVIDKAEKWRSDLIVIGSHGRTALGRFFLGSVSQKVVTEARCSVRVARNGIRESNRPVRIVIGVDGSPGAEAAVQAVAVRAWPKHSEVLLVSSTGPRHHENGSTMAEEERYALQVQEKARMELHEAWLEVSSRVMSDDPKQSIVDEADRWKADCIFVGTNGYGRLGRWLLGSVSTAVVTRANCSVEVVRVTET